MTEAFMTISKMQEKHEKLLNFKQLERMNQNAITLHSIMCCISMRTWVLKLHEVERLQTEPLAMHSYVYHVLHAVAVPD